MAGCQGTCRGRWKGREEKGRKGKEREGVHVRVRIHFMACQHSLTAWRSKVCSDFACSACSLFFPPASSIFELYFRALFSSTYSLAPTPLRVTQGRWRRGRGGRRRWLGLGQTYSLTPSLSISAMSSGPFGAAGPSSLRAGLRDRRSRAGLRDRRGGGGLGVAATPGAGPTADH